ncbi:rhamnogalacturonase B [Sodiomyces alkalinus F11]|uniref:rhamnogalacturonan endolyase n=1 Tax=Sodiomyces alkalinus (strain CBS 110278 / VKM F-3762 / F11) TaxID=1314773 RepID=A0A3N2Q7Z0_SODAK|nr:rhamnogalacturonase B [Sodiomyces alkalinus F11]ROT42860.1 rhamnogalacturonase B [Sodiomyces alkalinus F11]
MSILLIIRSSPAVSASPGIDFLFWLLTARARATPPRWLSLPSSSFSCSPSSPSPRLLLGFGYSFNGNNIVVNAGSANPLYFSVSRSNCDINSIRYRGHELQYQSQGTHIGSGLGSANVQVTQQNNYIKITCETPTLTHYLVARQGDSTIYMATHIAAQPSIGELRYIARLNSNILPWEHPFGAVSITGGSSATIEGSDVFLVNGQTRSKFYSSERYIDRGVHCVHGNNPEPIHACMVIPQPESSSGGPFFRDIETNNGGAFTALYNYMNSGHAETEPYRMGLHGPYALTFSRSGIPKLREVDLSFFAHLGIRGYVPDHARGRVSGNAWGIPSGHQMVVHWYNNEAQYWTYANSNGAFTSPPMKPGTYTQVLYQTEYKVAERQVSVWSGGTAWADISSTYTPAQPLFQIGRFDGQPFGFRNADKFLRMHPSDHRMSSWTRTFNVGASHEGEFPMAVFQAVNNNVEMYFHLNSAPGAAVFHVSTTLSFAGARPHVRVNNWSGPIPPAPRNINSRGVTRGAYRGWGEQYYVDIPAGVLVAGRNTITISAASGSSGSTFLSPNFVFDAVALYRR